ncbi:MAG: hypothetical protein E7384_02565 [Ruminococcaceae bacterium]|nr:hypothetical protein [Oscillospiraceae bacterium]
MDFLQRKNKNISGEINESSGDVARKRLLNTINSERTHLSPVVTEMMQNDIRQIIENYIGGDIDSSDLVIEIKNPNYSAFVCDVNLVAAEG